MRLKLSGAAHRNVYRAMACKHRGFIVAAWLLQYSSVNSCASSQPSAALARRELEKWKRYRPMRNGGGMSGMLRARCDAL